MNMNFNFISNLCLELQTVEEDNTSCTFLITKSLAKIQQDCENGIHYCSFCSSITDY